MILPCEPTHNPPVPFTDNISGGLKIGNLITINGTVLNSAKSFQINLACGSKIDAKAPDRSPIAFHFNPRFNQHFVARNTFLQSAWGMEESDAPNKYFPFAAGRKFEVMILVSAKDFKVAVSGQHFISYAHRMPITNVNTINIQGNVGIDKIFIEDVQPVPSEIGGVKPILEGVYEPPIPFLHKIPQGMIPGRIIYISGKPVPYPVKFSIDFTCDDNTRNIAFHFNPRFPTQAVVLNTLLEGRWGTEEGDDCKFPFERRISFDVKICCEEKRFVVFVNGHHFCTYTHRVPYELITKLSVEGDVTIASAIFQ